MKMASEFVGWFGAGLILSAYALVSFKVLESSTLTYQILNIAGALGIVYHSVSKRDYQPAVLNIVWGLVGVVAIVKILFL